MPSQTEFSLVVRTLWAVAAQAAVVLATAFSMPAHAQQDSWQTALPGVGTWETTLKGRDLDGNGATFEAYYDTDLNITWLADPNFSRTSGYDRDGLMGWNAQQNWVSKLNINGITGWRLPAVKPVNPEGFNYTRSYDGTTDVGFNITSKNSELAHLFHVTLGNTSYFNTLGVEYGAVAGWHNIGPFAEDYSSYQIIRGYWTGDASGSPAMYFLISDGSQNMPDSYVPKSYQFQAWAVHSGDVGAVPEPSTYALMGLGLAAVLSARRWRVLGL